MAARVRKRGAVADVRALVPPSVDRERLQGFHGGGRESAAGRHCRRSIARDGRWVGEELPPQSALQS